MVSATHKVCYYKAQLEGYSDTIGLAGPNFGTWKNVGTHAGYNHEDDTGDWIGAYLVYNITKNPVVTSKLGISFLSTDQACKNVFEESGTSFDFNEFRDQSSHRWDAILSKINVERPVPPRSGMIQKDYLTIFYSSLYRMHMMPSDRNGENPLWNSTAPVYDDFYTIWDTFRCSSPLLTLIQPEVQREILMSLIDMQQHEGWAPDGRAGFTSGLTQGGSNVDMILTDGYIKGLYLDWNAAYAALQADAELEPPFPEGLRKGRSRLNQFIDLGYVAQDPKAWWDGRYVPLLTGRYH
jgi:putative alpha-1,2-mannosidase